MKLNGKTVHVPGIAYAVVPRPENVGGDIVFTCNSVLNYDECDALNPEPTPPWLKHVSGPSKQDYDDKEYIAARGVWATRRQSWMVLKSLQGTPNLEWEMVDLGDASTWGKYTEELEKCGFAPMEISRIIDAVYEACGLSQKKINEAMERFLSGARDKAAAALSLKGAVSTTSSGELVSALT